MEYQVNRHHKNTTKVIGKHCVKCKVHIVAGDQVVTKSHKRVYHKACWDSLFFDAQKKTTAKWRKNHLEEYRKWQNEWRKRNPEKVRAYRKSYRAKHPDKVKAARRRHDLKHGDDVRAARKRYYEKHPFQGRTPEQTKKAAEDMRRLRAKWKLEASGGSEQ